MRQLPPGCVRSVVLHLIWFDYLGDDTGFGRHLRGEDSSEEKERASDEWLCNEVAGTFVADEQ
jgi:hypothetical protein